MIMNKPLSGQDRWKDIWVHLQQPETVLTAFQVLTHKALLHPHNLEDDALAGLQALAI